MNYQMRVKTHLAELNKTFVHKGPFNTIQNVRILKSSIFFCSTIDEREMCCTSKLCMKLFAWNQLISIAIFCEINSAITIITTKKTRAGAIKHRAGPKQRADGKTSVTQLLQPVRGTSTLNIAPRNMCVPRAITHVLCNFTQIQCPAAKCINKFRKLFPLFVNILLVRQQPSEITCTNLLVAG